MVLLAVLWIPTVGQRPAAALSVGERAPSFVLPADRGGRFDLRSEARQHPVLVAFVSPRCRPCQESRPALEELCRTYGPGHQLGVISVLLGGDPDHPALDTGQPADPIESFVTGDEDTAAAYGVFGTPVFFLVGRDGSVLWKHVGRLRPGALDPVLATVLSEGVAAAPPDAPAPAVR